MWKPRRTEDKRSFARRESSMRGAKHSRHGARQREPKISVIGVKNGDVILRKVIIEAAPAKVHNPHVVANVGACGGGVGR